MILCVIGWKGRPGARKFGEGGCKAGPGGSPCDGGDARASAQITAGPEPELHRASRARARVGQCPRSQTRQPPGLTWSIRKVSRDGMQRRPERTPWGSMWINVNTGQTWKPGQILVKYWSNLEATSDIGWMRGGARLYLAARVIHVCSKSKGSGTGLFAAIRRLRF